MAAKSLAERENEEVWELTVPGRVHVEVTNHLGHPANRTASGKGSRIRIGTYDRQLAEEKIRVGEHNPFRNGMLVQISGVREGDESNSLDDTQMLELFNLSPEEFGKTIVDLSELNIRRLKAMTGPADASASQIRMVDELIEKRWPIGKSTPTYDEMMQ